ncbi:MAG: protein kinase domain-containing protein [Planctomycetota bacterium]
MSLSVGQEFAHYRVVSQLGRGAMGEVFRARDTRLDRDVAVKVLSDDFAEDADRVLRLEREAKVLASLHHAHIGQIHALEPLGNSKVLVLELVEGEDVSERLARGPLPVREALPLCAQIAEGLEAAHEAGVIHRDLKPANVRVTPRGEVKVLDFGLAKPLAETAAALTSLTGEGVLVGTPAYMSPEAVRGHPLCRRTDVWAFGCILYECLTGRRAFDAGSVPDMVAAILEREPDLSKLPPDTPPRVRELVARCLDKDPRTRLQDMGEARIALRAPRDASGAAAGAAAGGAAAGAARRSGVPRSTLLLMAAPAVVLAVALVFVLNQRPAAAPRNPLDGPVPWVLALEGSEYDVAVSPGGDAVVFGSDRDGVFDLWYCSLTGGTPVNYTRGRVPMFDELIRNLGFNGGVPWVQNISTLLVNEVRGPEQPMVPLPATNLVELDLSRDGARTLYHTRDPGDPIFVHDLREVRGPALDTGGPGIHLHYPVWSAEETWIYYAKGVPGIWAMDLWRMRADGTGQPQQLTFDQLDVSFPTPLDEDTVLFIAKEPDGSGPYVFSLDVPSGHVQRVTVGVAQYTSLHASDDGHTVVATRATPTSALWQVPLRGPDEAMSGEADVERQADVPVTEARMPAFGGGRLFYLASYGGGDGLYVLEDGRQRKLWEDPKEPLLFPPSVSPSGDMVALVRRGEQRMKLAVLEVSSGAVVKDLETDVDVRGACTWSPDETALVIGGLDPEGAPGLFRIGLEDGSWHRLSSETAMDPAWALDRDLIVFGVNTRGGPRINMRAVDREGEPVGVDVSSMAPRYRLGAPVRFTRDGRGLVYIAFRHQPFRQDFFHLDLATGETRRLTELELNGFIRHFDLSPDGAHIVFDRTEMNSDVVVWRLPERGD